MISDEIRIVVQWVGPGHTQSSLGLTMIRRLYCLFLLIPSVYSLHPDHLHPDLLHPDLHLHPPHQTRNLTEEDYIVDMETEEIVRDIFVENGTAADLIPSLYQNEDNRTFLDIEDVEIFR